MNHDGVKIVDINFKTDDSYTHVVVKFETNNASSGIGTLRRNRFALDKSVADIVNSELNSFNFLSWPDGDHKIKMHPLEYRLISEVCEYVCDLGLEQYRRLSTQALMHNTCSRVAVALKNDNIATGEKEISLIREILDVIYDEVPVRHIQIAGLFEVSKIVTNRLVTRRF